MVGLLFELIGVPAGMLLGSAVGAAVCNQSWTRRIRRVEFPISLRQVGFIALGLVSGTMLTVNSVVSTATIALPIVVAYLVLGGLNLALVTMLMRRYDIDPATAVLAVTPGGLGEVTALAIDKGAQVGVVLTVHAVRLFVLVFLLLPVLLVVLT